MSEKDLLARIMYAFYDLANASYKKYDSDKNETNLFNYKVVSEVYSKIIKITNLKDMDKFFNELNSKYKSALSSYESKLKEFNNLKVRKASKEEINKAYKELLELASITNNYISMINLYYEKKSSMKKTTEVKKEEPKKSEVKKSEVKKEESKKTEIKKEEPKKSEVKKNEIKKSVHKKADSKGVIIDYTDPEINEIVSINSKLAILKARLETLDPSSKNAITIRNEINALCDRRMEIAESYLGNDGINRVRMIESAETRAAITIDSLPQRTFEYTPEEYKSELDKILKIIADFKFYGVDSKYYKQDTNLTDAQNEALFQKRSDAILRKFNNMISSAYEGSKSDIVMSDKEEEDLSCEDLLAYFETYNLTGGIDEFKQKHSSGKIGSDAATKEMRDSGVKLVKAAMMNLSNQATKKATGVAKKTSGKIKVADKTKYKNGIVKEVDAMSESLFRDIMVAKSKSVANVHR